MQDYFWKKGFEEYFMERENRVRMLDYKGRWIVRYIDYEGMSSNVTDCVSV